MMYRFTISLFAGLLVACGCTDRWIVETEGGSTITFADRDRSIEIIAPAGVTLWYVKPLSGDYRIGYNATVVMQGGESDRLADLNCFWAASDPVHPDDFFARSKWRGGTFANYNSLDLFYVGYGGNDNTTTRFRKYHGARFGAPTEEVKPLLGEYTDAKHLLTPNRPIHIEITVSSGKTTYAVDGEELFSRKLLPGEGDGYFGLRLLSNHTLISNLKIEKL